MVKNKMNGTNMWIILIYNFYIYQSMLLLRGTNYFYHIRKPRIWNQNHISLIKYRKLMRDTRRRIHQEAADYQQKIQTQFLNKRKQDTLRKHRENQCNYRSQIIKNGFILLKNLQQWQKTDQIRNQHLQNWIHKEHLAKINRDRILKILNHQSKHYWFNHSNLDERLTDQTIVPDYAGSTQYYHRLSTEAIAYQTFSYDTLEEYSGQGIIVYKNKYLIPLYNQILKIIKTIKTNQYTQNENLYSKKVNQINRLLNMPEFQVKRTEELQKAAANYEKNKEQLLKKMQTPQNRNKFIKQKIKQFRNLFAHWKKYVKVLNLTPAELKMLKDKKHSFEEQKKFLNSMITNKKLKIKQDTTANIKQKYTSQQQIEIQNYFNKQQKKNQQLDPKYEPKKENINQLQQLLKDSLQIVKQIKQPVKYENNIQQMKIILNKTPQQLKINQKDRFRQNSSVIIETLKKLTQDEQLIKVLDEIGEVEIQQGVLFKKVWEVV